MSEPTLYSASWLINADAPPIAGGALLVKNGTILAAGPLHQLRSGHSGQVVDFPGCAIIPGFINAHTHLELTYFPSWLLHSAVDYAPRRFSDWIMQLIKIKRTVSADDYPHSILEGVRMCLESGTTAIGEIVTNSDLAEVYKTTSLAGRLYFELLGHEPEFFTSRLALATSAALHKDSESFLPGFSPHSPYTIGENGLSRIREAAGTYGLPLSIHVSEARCEAEFVAEGTGELADDFYPFVGWEKYLGQPAGCSSTELLDRHGLLTPSTLAVHCVHVSEADARIIKARGTHIALCPRSNSLLDVGRAPVALFKKTGIPLALGTDSLASNHSLSLWDELRFALETFPDDLTEQDVFRMVTTGGATALGLSSVCGSLEVGKRADFQIVGNCAGMADNVLERTMREGVVKEVFVSGRRFTGETNVR